MEEAWQLAQSDLGERLGERECVVRRERALRARLAEHEQQRRREAEQVKQRAVGSIRGRTGPDAWWACGWW